MFGKTNSFTVSAGSGGKGCDMVYAVNSTGGEIMVGSKVWLNQHILGTNNNASISWSNQYTPYPTVFNHECRMFANNASTMRRVEYNRDTNSWHFFDSSTMKADNISAVYFKDGVVFGYSNHNTTESYLFKKNGEQVSVNGCVLSSGKVIDRATRKLTTYNPETGVIDTSSGFVMPTNSNSVMFAHLDGNLLFYQRSSDGISYIYDVSDYANPVLLATPTFSTGYVHAFYMTGVGVGNYILTRFITKTEFSVGQFYLYKIVSGYMIQLATDVPESLLALIGKNCRFSYNNETGVFIIGTATNLFFYKFENGKFHEFEVKFGALPACASDFAYMARLTDDMSSLAITCKSGSYYCTYIYRLQTFDDKWYAENFTAAGDLSIIGYATGEQNDEGLYEIRTLLPEVCHYNLTVTPTPDVIEFKGEAL